MPRLLLIEDDSDTAESLQALLIALGYEVAWMRNGREALDYAQEERADVVLTDILLPQMDGLEVIRALRQLWPEVRILAMTGHRDGAYLRAAEVYGAVTTLEKPFNLEQLREALLRGTALQNPQGS